MPVRCPRSLGRQLGQRLRGEHDLPRRGARRLSQNNRPRLKPPFTRVDQAPLLAQRRACGHRVRRDLLARRLGRLRCRSELPAEPAARRGGVARGVGLARLRHRGELLAELGEPRRVLAGARRGARRRERAAPARVRLRRHRLLGALCRSARRTGGGSAACELRARRSAAIPARGGLVRARPSGRRGVALLRGRLLDGHVGPLWARRRRWRRARRTLRDCGRRRLGVRVALRRAFPSESERLVGRRNLAHLARALRAVDGDVSVPG